MCQEHRHVESYGSIRHMKPKASSHSQAPLIITRTMIWTLVILYAIVLVGRSTYQNYGTNREIEAQKNRITELEKNNQLLQLSLIYYRSKAFQEVEARRRLGLKGKDEHVIALPEAKTEPSLSIALAKSNQSVVSRSTPPYLAWWVFFFGK